MRFLAAPNLLDIPELGFIEQGVILPILSAAGRYSVGGWEDFLQRKSGFKAG